MNGLKSRDIIRLGVLIILATIRRIKDTLVYTSLDCNSEKPTRRARSHG